MKEITVLGIDLAKSVHHAVGMNTKGAVVLKKRLKRLELLEVLGSTPACTIAMEACSGAQWWARQAHRHGHKVKIIPPQFVKAFVKSNKNDWADAEAIAEAASRPTMRFCQVKTPHQQQLQQLHRVRARLLKQSTALSNEIRGFLAEYGVTIAQGSKALRGVPEALERNVDDVPPLALQLIHEMLEEYWALKERLGRYDKRLENLAENHPESRRMMTKPGIGPVISTAVLAKVSDPNDFKHGRNFSAWIGIVPKQHSTGGKDRLLGISKRGDRYLRQLFIHGARSLLYSAHLKTDPFSQWAMRVKERRGWNRAVVAIANKNARIVWAMLKYGEDYRSECAARQ